MESDHIVEKGQVAPESLNVDAGSPVEHHTPKQLGLVFVGLALAIFVASINGTIVATALPVIANDLNGLSSLAWIGTSYLLTSTAFQPLSGVLSDIFGRLYTFLGFIAFFVLGSVLCGAANGIGMMIGARLIQGVGGGGLISLCMIIIADIVSIRDQGKYQGIIGATSALAMVIGPLAGGGIVDHTSWRLIFYVFLPVMGFSCVVLIMYLRIPIPQGALSSKVKKIDFLGALVLCASTSMILLALSWGGSQYSWSSPTVLCLLIFGFLLLGGFVLVEAKFATLPILPVYLFRIRNFWTSNAIAFVAGFFMYGAIYFVPLYYRNVHGYDATAGGLSLLPLMLSLVFASMIGGGLTSRFGVVRPFIWIGTVLLAVGSGLLSTLNESSPRGVEIIVLVVAGLGLGLIIQSAQIAVQASVETKDMATGTAAVSFFRNFGGVLGVGISATILQDRWSNFLIQQFNTNGIPLSALASLDLSDVSTISPDLRVLVIRAFIMAMNYIWYISCAASCIGVFFALFIKYVELSKAVPAEIVPSTGSQVEVVSEASSAKT
ncbi:hypothetical protein SmJEL517_g02194 [Synchytrium microbalum]|uniref:Major facilitator superfamily (MFS) profile domain-containing protein n=1 Tax=Synchytrium microbalum TaxID=1806994 RepID=A0A507C8R4_9FUNG|nr:uncharacterized protein SmJEL517_g02194 [Synchytrium microbalum]TPX35539.1 hypothetical protein SmJEL517_g02194 [Synchytrium microbalum]